MKPRPVSPVRAGARFFHKDGRYPLLTLVLAVYYALFPVVHLLVTCTTRDVLFSTLLTLMVYCFYLLARDPDASMSKTGNMLTAIVFTLFSRNNNSGPLAMLLLLAICIVIGQIFGRKHIRYAVLFAACGWALWQCIRFAVRLCRWCCCATLARCSW